MNEDEQKEENKIRDAKREQALCSVADRVIGKDPKTGALSGGRAGDRSYGKVRVWFKKQKKYMTMWPVDAAEAIAGGGATLDKPGNEPEAE